jgi:hypothetical protein
MSKKYWPEVLFVLIIILAAAASRLVKHPFNFTPIIAMSIFGGCYLKKYWGLLIPLGAMLIGDYFIGFYDLPVMLSVYVGVAIAYFLGMGIGSKRKWLKIIGFSILSSVIFFIITNLAVWFFFDWYSHDLKGLLSCFTLALPFFKNSIVGDLFYSVAFFGLYEAFVAIHNRITARQNKLTGSNIN